MMRLESSLILTLTLLLTSIPVHADQGKTWGKRIKIHTSWEEAIDEAQDKGMPLFIYYGYKEDGASRNCDRARHAVNTMADTQDGYPILKKNFIFLNVYPQGANDKKEYGPEGPFRIKVKTSPTFIVKRSDGHTIETRTSNKNVSRISRWIPEVAKKARVLQGQYNAKIVPLMKDFKKAEKYLGRKKTVDAYLIYRRVETRGFDEQIFGKIPPAIAVESAERAKLLLEEFLTEVDAVAKLSTPEKQHAAYDDLAKRFADIVEVLERIGEAREKIDGSA